MRRSRMASLCAVSAISLASFSVADESAAGHALTAEAVKARADIRQYDCRTTGKRVGKKQAVTVHISNISARETKKFFGLDSKLDRGIRLAHVGEYDGNGIGLDGSGADYFAYGPSATS